MKVIWGDSGHKGALCDIPQIRTAKELISYVKLVKRTIFCSSNRAGRWRSRHDSINRSGRRSHQQEPSSTLREGAHLRILCTSLV